MPKTYQAMMDEAAEREEQAAEAAREQRLMEEQEAAEEIEMHMGGGEMADTDAGEGEERDLDEDVPEAVEEGFSLEDDGVEDGEGVLGEEVGGGVGELEGEGVDRDLDEDVPEAGSYQHTDTEVEDESSEDEGEGFGSSGGVQRRVSAPRSEGSSILMGSSVLGSSPMGTRQSSGAFARRLGGREN